MAEAVTALRDAIPVSFFAIGLWLTAAILLAGLMIFCWRRLSGS